MLRNDSGRRGFSLGELVLIFVILAIMMIIMLPGLLRMRASARQQNCQYNLTVLHQALEAYHTTHMRYPIGTINPAGPIRSVAEGYHHNWIAGLLPSLNAMGIYQAIDRDVSVYDEANTMPRATRLARLLCPSASARFENTSCYAGSHHDGEEPIDSTNNGMMILNTALSRDDAVDGLDYTVIVGEKLTRHDPELGWISGTRSTLRNTGHRINEAMPYPPGEPVPPTYVGGFVSAHPGGAFLMMCGGRIELAPDDMDTEVLRQMGRRDDRGESPDDVIPPDADFAIDPAAGR